MKHIVEEYGGLALGIIGALAILGIVVALISKDGILAQQLESWLIKAC